MFVNHGKEPSWVLQFSKREQILMLAMANYETKQVEEIRKNRK